MNGPFPQNAQTLTGDDFLLYERGGKVFKVLLSQLNTFYAETPDQTPAEILTALLTVDGAASLLDADLLDGLEATTFPTISSGAGAPGTTPTKVGDIHIDTTNGHTYSAVGVASSADWKELVDLGGTEGRVPIDTITLGKGSTAPNETILGNFVGYAYSLNDDSKVDVSLPTDLDPTKDILVHINWYCDEAYATNSGEIRWEIAYGLVPNDTTEAVDAPTHSGTLNSGDVNIPANAKFLTQSEVTIPAADVADDDDMLGMTLKRVALGDGANPTAEPVITEIHLEYTRL